MTDKLLVVLVPGNKVVINKLNQASRVTVTLKLKVDSLSVLHDTDSLIVSLMLENQLLEEEEGPLVDYTLSNLHLTGPSVGRPRLLTVVALGIVHDKFNSE